MALAPVTSTAVIASTASSASYTGSSFTVSSGSDRVLVLIIHGFLDAAADSGGASSVTHNGQSMTKAVGPQKSNSRSWSEIWYLVNPTAGSGTTSVTCNQTQRALCATLIEYTGADQTTPIPTTNSGQADATTSATLAITTTLANSLIVGGVSIDSAPENPVVGGGATSRSAGDSGAASEFNDNSFAAGDKAVASAGAANFSISWDNAEDAAWAIVELAEAASSGVTGTGALTTGVVTASGAGVKGVTGTGALTIGVIAPAGAGVKGLTGSGALTMPVTEVSGSAPSVGITGSGALTAPVVTASGAGVVGHTGTGALAAPAVTLAGSGVRGVAGTGTISIQPTELTGAGSIGHVGTGALTAPVVSVSGAGIRGITGTGALTTPSAELYGSSYIRRGADYSDSANSRGIIVLETGSPYHLVLDAAYASRQFDFVGQLSVQQLYDESDNLLRDESGNTLFSHNVRVPGSTGIELI